MNIKIVSETAVQIFLHGQARAVKIASLSNLKSFCNLTWSWGWGCAFVMSPVSLARRTSLISNGPQQPPSRSVQPRYDHLDARYHLQLAQCRQRTYNVHLLVGVPGASTLLRSLDEVGLGPQGRGEVEWAPPHTATTPTKIRVVVK
jgi:hypothetical protein